MKNRIVCDIDGVIGDIYSIIVMKLLEKNLLTQDQKKDLIYTKSMYIEDVYSIGLQDEIHKIIDKEILEVKPYPEVSYVLPKLCQYLEASIIFITARGDWLHSRTVEWIMFNIPNMPNFDLYHSKTKVELLKQIKPIIYIEDSKELADLGSSYSDRVYLVDRKWNRENNTHNNKIIKVENFLDIYLHEITNGKENGHAQEKSETLHRNFKSVNTLG
ncbi:MAG: hypothetical protein ACOCQD_00480 [archaeon]